MASWFLSVLDLPSLPITLPTTHPSSVSGTVSHSSATPPSIASSVTSSTPLTSSDLAQLTSAPTFPTTSIGPMRAPSFSTTSEPSGSTSLLIQPSPKATEPTPGQLSTTMPTPEFTTTKASTDQVTSSTFVASSIRDISTSIPTSDTRHSSRTGTMVGIVLGVGAIALCLVLGLLWYLKRRRYGSQTARPDVCMFTGALSFGTDHHESGAEVWTVSEGETQMGGQLVSQVPAAGLDFRHYVARPRWDSLDTVSTSENSGRGPWPIGESASRCRRGMAYGRTEAALGARPSSWDEMNHNRCPRREADGGVRLAGGRPGEALVEDDLDSDQSSMSDGFTLPPPYSSHVEDA